MGRPRHDSHCAFAANELLLEPCLGRTGLFEGVVDRAALAARVTPRQVGSVASSPESGAWRRPRLRSVLFQPERKKSWSPTQALTVGDFFGAVADSERLARALTGAVRHRDWD